MNVDCTVCRTPTHDSFLCARCWNELAVDLADLAGYQRNANGERMIPLAVELEVVLSRQDRLGKVSVMVSGTCERPLPVNLHAGRVRDRLAAVLRAWVDYICTTRNYCQDTRATVITDAQFLIRHESEVRGLHNVDELVQQVHDVIDSARRVIDKRSVRIFVGECGAQMEADGDDPAWTCTAALWADSAYAMTRCSVCDTSWPSMDRWEGYLAKVRGDRLTELRNRQLGARRLATVLTALGHTISEGAIRKWAKAGMLEVAGLDQHGRKVYRAQDVLALLDTSSSSAA